MPRILSEEPDPWDEEPVLPKRTAQLRELKSTRPYRRGEVDAETLSESREMFTRENAVNIFRRVEVQKQLAWCLFKYEESAPRRCDRLLQEVLKLQSTPDFDPNGQPKLTRELFDQMFKDDAPYPDIKGVFKDKEETD